MNKLRIYIYLFTLLLFAGIAMTCVGCGEKQVAAEEYTETVYSPEFATGFDIVKSLTGESVIIRTKTPWQGAEDVVTSLFISRNGEMPPAGFSGQVLKNDAKRIVCMSSTQVAMLDAIGEVSRTVGASGRDFIHNRYVRGHRDEIGNIGFTGSVDFETLMALDPDIILLYGMYGECQEEGMLRQLGIPFMYIGDYLEESPLGKAEWLVAIAEITGKRNKGIEVFSSIPQKYQSLKSLANTLTDSVTPTVMLNAPYGNAWFISPKDSYIGQLISDAGAKYVFDRDTGTESVKIDREEALRLLEKAEFWLNPGTVEGIDELQATYPKFASAPSVRNGKVFNNTLRTNSNGGNDYFESGVVHPDYVLSDLIKIFHPELLPDSDFHYFRQLK